MLQKKFLLVMAALVSVSLVLTGCPTDAEAGPAGTAGSSGTDGPVLISRDISAEDLQLVIDEGRELLLVNVNITGTGVVNFKTAKAKITGKLTTADGSTAVAILAAEADLAFAEGAVINLGEGDDVFIGTAAHAAKASGSYAANVVAAVSGAGDWAGITGGVTGIKDLELTAGLVIPSGLKVVVYGTLTVGAASPSGGYGGGIVAVGTVLVTASNVTALSAAANVDVTHATIKLEKNEEVAITLPAALSGPVFTVTGEQGVLKVTGPTTISAHVTGNNGYVEFVSAVTQAKITGGGRVRFADPASDGTATAFAAASPLVTNSITGSIIEFPYGFSTSQYAAVALDGDIRLGAGKAITFGHADGTVKLADGSAVYVGNGAAATKLLEATADTVLTPVATAALTATAAVTGASSAPAKLTLSAAKLTVTSGELTVPADAELAAGNELVVADDAAIKTDGGLITVSGTTGKVNGFTAPAATTVSLSGVAAASSKTTITLGANLVVPAAASTTLAIPAAVTLDAGLFGVTLQADKTNQGTLEVASGGTLKAGATEITGKWEPAKPTGEDTLSVTIRVLIMDAVSNNTEIGGNAVFTATTSGSGVITQTAGTANLLVIGTGTTVDLGSDGKIVLKAHASETAKSGAVGFSTGTGTAAVIKTGNTAGDGNAGQIKGAATTGTVTLASADTTNKLATITSTATDADIRPAGTTADLTIDKNTEVENAS